MSSMLYTIFKFYVNEWETIVWLIRFEFKYCQGKNKNCTDKSSFHSISLIQCNKKKHLFSSWFMANRISRFFFFRVCSECIRFWCLGVSVIYWINDLFQKRCEWFVICFERVGGWRKGKTEKNLMRSEKR